MKKIFTLLSILSIGYSTLAQTAQVTIESDTVVCSGDANFLFTGDNHVNNGNLSDSAHLKWTRYELSMPTGWETTVCDPNNCYSVSTATKNFSLKPNFNGILKVNFIPNGVVGSGLVKLNVQSTDVAGTSLDAYFFATSTLGTATPTVQEVKDIILYPTPVRENVYVVFNPNMKPERLDVYNLLGQKVKSFPVQLERNSYKTELQLADLDKGLYFIRVYQQGSNLVLTKQFTKE